MSSSSLLYLFFPSTTEGRFISPQHPEIHTKHIKIPDVETKPPIKAFTARKCPFESEKLKISVLYEGLPHLFCYEITKDEDENIFSLQPPSVYVPNAKFKAITGKTGQEIIQEAITMLEVEGELSVIGKNTNAYLFPNDPEEEDPELIPFEHDGSVVKRITFESNCFFKITENGHLFIAGDFSLLCKKATLPNGEKGINDLEAKGETEATSKKQKKQQHTASEDDDDESSSLSSCSSSSEGDNDRLYYRMNFFPHEKIVKVCSFEDGDPVLYTLTESNNLYFQEYQNGKAPIQQVVLANNRKFKDMCCLGEGIIAVTVTGDVYIRDHKQRVVKMIFERPIAKVFIHKVCLFFFAEKNQGMYIHTNAAELLDFVVAGSTDSITRSEAGVSEEDLGSDFAARCKQYEIENIRVRHDIAVMHFKKIALKSLFQSKVANYADTRFIF